MTSGMPRGLADVPPALSAACRGTSIGDMKAQALARDTAQHLRVGSDSQTTAARLAAAQAQQGLGSPGCCKLDEGRQAGWAESDLLLRTPPARAHALSHSSSLHDSGHLQLRVCAGYSLG